MLEKVIETQIFQYLQYRKDVFVFKVNNVGIFDTTRMVFRRPNPKLHTPGVSDFIGIFNGKPLAIEVKSKKGKLTDDQKVFLKNFEEAGGLAFVARSVEDVKDGLS